MTTRTVYLYIMGTVVSSKLTTVKECLCDDCGYTFDTLKENMPKALESVQLPTIQTWEHRVFQWMDVYRVCMGTSEAQKVVKENSSKIYKSHHCTFETDACTFDD